MGSIIPSDNPDGYNCHTGTGVACPIGLGVPAAAGPRALVIEA
jgi:hypothetical protein